MKVFYLALEACGHGGGGASLLPVTPLLPATGAVRVARAGHQRYKLSDEEQTPLALPESDSCIFEADVPVGTAS